ncbi:MAG: outer membrane protein assembly factor BamD [Hyphomicrobiaceae bacterium]|nr:outer membrane protein assembly factor BamD [Hyphomicrobiaceae bacterium]
MMIDRTRTRPAWRQIAAAAIIAVCICGCASSSDVTKALNPDPPAKMYADADALLAKGRFEDAAKKFEDLDRDHPYAAEARRAMVMAAFSYHKAGKHPEAIASAKRYTTLHPGTKDAALAHHVIASSYFAEIKDPAHDQTAARKALAELKIITSRYPDSPYARQAENRIRLAEDSVAASEMNVGRYYLKNGQFVAAINRFKTVVSDYQTTQHVEEALHRLVEANVALGIMPEAQSAAAVLGYNYPSSKWYENSYALLGKQGLKPHETEGSWISRQWKKLLPGGAPAQKPQPAAAPSGAPAGGPAPATSPPIEPLPPERVPSADTPTASTRTGRPMGLTAAR